MVKRIAYLVVFLLTLFVLNSCGRQASRLRSVVLYENDGSEEELTLENEFLRLRFLPKTAEIILMDKASGVQWRSNPQDAANDPLADAVTGYFLKSQFSLEYADNAGVGMTLYSGDNSVALGAYGYAIEDNILEVRYTIGDIERSYLIPPAAQESRMVTFLEKMELDDRRKVEASYRLYDINNLRSGDDKNQLLANYPDLNRTKVYVLRDTTKDYMKEMMAEYFAGAGYTLDDFSEDSSRYTASSGADKPAFNITLRYSLDGKSLVVNVPFDKIAYRPSYPITQLSVLPFMGSGGVNDEGYLLVPDGSGALIYFNNGKQNQIAYNINVYGWDEAMPRDAVINDNKAPFPAFGIQKNGEALLCVIEEGSSYAGVRADVSGRNSSQNYVYPRFTMVHGAIIDISGRSDRAVYLYERSLPETESITLRYITCARDGYVGMAKEYRSWLQRKYPSLKTSVESGIPIAIEIPGAVNKTQHRLGIPFDLPLKLTSYKEAQSMIDDFAQWGWKNVRIKLTGWFNRSVDHSIPSKIKLINELGKKKYFKSLVSAAKKNNYEIYPEADFLFLKNKKPFDGFNLYRDAARYVNRKRIEKFPYSFVWFGERTSWGKLSYVARPVYMMSLIDGFKNKAGALGLSNIAFKSLGAKLSGDYHEKRLVSREASMKMRQDKLAELTGKGTSVLLNTGFAYAAPWADFITDMAIDDQMFGITDASVPFYPMAFHGLVPYTGPAINLAEDYTKNLLKTIESGAGLYFSFMTEETSILQETKFRQFYANEYEKWSPDANALYQMFTADFSGLYGQAIINHEIISTGLTLTEYEDGRRVIVNSNESAAIYDGVIINARSYEVLRHKEDGGN
ncbi:MAG: DUF5696 domain-containing protein [Treponema sp.]|jgi:hypothetical protein|nr:DUF5696 domain-containing protein [Treponema sp.]